MLRLTRLASLGMGLCLGSRLVAAEATTQPHHAEHIVVVVFDGLRPDSVSETDMPNLYALGKSGTVFARHHPVYPSSTEVNGTSLATGAYPDHSGIMANNEYRPDIELMKSVATEAESTVRKGDAVSGGKYILLPTVAEILRAAGKRTAVAGTKPVALLLDRAERDAATGRQSRVVVQGKTLSPGLLKDGDAAEFPPKADERKTPNRIQDEWAAHVLLDRLWSDGVPEYSVLWMSDPDYSQHGVGPNDPMARQALHNSDANLGRVLAALDRLGIRDKTDVMVVSDHGFSLISRNYDLTKLLKSGGFDAASKFDAPPRPGQIVVVGNSGSACLYVIGHDKTVAGQLVEFLQQSDFAGAIFSREAFEGTFPLSIAAVDSKDAPDIIFSGTWSGDSGNAGMPGTLVSEGKRLPGQGNHSSLSRYDMHNTLVANGPDFKTNFVDELPSGNADVAPTILHILGVQADRLDGRVLSEALIGETPPTETAETKTLESSRKLGTSAWKQYLRVSSIGRYVYFDEGNRGDFPSSGPAFSH